MPTGARLIFWAERRLGQIRACDWADRTFDIGEYRLEGQRVRHPNEPWAKPLVENLQFQAYKCFGKLRQVTMTSRRILMKGALSTFLSDAVASALAQKARQKRPSVALEEAQAVHGRSLIIDAHNDVPVERIHRGEKPLQWISRDLSYHTDVPRMKEAGYDVGFFIVGDGPTANLWVTIEQVLEQIEAHSGEFILVRSSQDAVRAGRTGKIGILMAIEGAGRWLDGKVEILRILQRLGVRSLGLTHGEGGPDAKDLQATKSPYGPCTAADRESERRGAGGLTPFGKDVLKACNELHIIADLAHINDKAFYEVLELSARPVIVSHTAVFSRCQHWRCLTDDQIKALASAGGAMGIAFAPAFIHADPKQATIDRLVEHICHVADLVGIDYVGIGSDFDGLGKEIPVVPEVSQLVRLTHSMLAHGLSEVEIQKVWGGNFLRLLKKNID
jgi:membrane dipeptidase